MLGLLVGFAKEVTDVVLAALTAQKNELREEIKNEMAIELDKYDRRQKEDDLQLYNIANKLYICFLIILVNFWNRSMALFGVVVGILILWATYTEIIKETAIISNYINFKHSGIPPTVSLCDLQVLQQ